MLIKRSPFVYNSKKSYLVLNFTLSTSESVYSFNAEFLRKKCNNIKFQNVVESKSKTEHFVKQQINKSDFFLVKTLDVNKIIKHSLNTAKASFAPTHLSATGSYGGKAVENCFVLFNFFISSFSSLFVNSYT